MKTPELKEKNQWVTFQCGDVGRRVRLTAHSERVLSLAALHVLTGHRSRTVPVNTKRHFQQSILQLPKKVRKQLLLFRPYIYLAHGCSFPMKSVERSPER